MGVVAGTWEWTLVQVLTSFVLNSSVRWLFCTAVQLYIVVIASGELITLGQEQAVTRSWVGQCVRTHLYRYLTFTSCLLACCMGCTVCVCQYTKQTGYKVVFMNMWSCDRKCCIVQTSVASNIQYTIIILTYVYIIILCLFYIVLFTWSSDISVYAFMLVC